MNTEEQEEARKLLEAAYSIIIVLEVLSPDCYKASRYTRDWYLRYHNLVTRNTVP